MQSCKFNDTSYQLNPISAYWRPAANEQPLLIDYANHQPDPATLRPLVQGSSWITIGNWISANSASMTYPYKSSTAFQQAYQQVINGELNRVVKNCTPPVLAGPYIPAGPLATVYATEHFTAPSIPQVDACFNGPASAMAPFYLRLFVSLPLFTGPGLYSFLCTDFQIVTVAIDKQPTNDVFFHIINKHSGQSINISGGSTAAGASIVQAPSCSGASDHWRIEPVSGGYFLVASWSASLTLNVPNCSTSDGTQIVQWQWGGGTPNELWQFLPVGGGYYKIISKNTNKLLTVSGGSTASGAAVVQQADANADYQLWSLGLL